MSSERTQLKWVKAELLKYKNAIDAIYNHNEAARAATIEHFGPHHNPKVLEFLGTEATQEEQQVSEDWNKLFLKAKSFSTGAFIRLEDVVKFAENYKSRI